MPKRKDEEPNYLARAKPKIAPDSFGAVVREAFLLEHQDSKDYLIAARIGKVTPGWVSQALQGPEKLESKAVSRFLAPIQSRRHRRRILRAWIDAKYEIDILERTIPTYSMAKPTEKTLQKINRQMIEGNLYVAAATALSAYKRAEQPTLRQRFLDQALLARQRSNLPGQAMYIAEEIARCGRVLGDVRREAHGLLARAQIIQQLPNSAPDEFWPLIQEVDDCLVAAGPLPSESPGYVICTDQLLNRIKASAMILFMERGRTAVDAKHLRSLIERLLPFTKSRRSADRFPYHHLIARAHCLLGEYFQAQEHLEQAYNSGQGFILHGREMCGIIQARVFEATESSEHAETYLINLSQNCLHRYDLAHVQALETALARLKARNFQVNASG